MEKYVLGIDMGTTGSKGVLMGSAMNIKSSYYTKHEVLNPRAGYWELDANVLWQEFLKICKFFLNKVKPEQIITVGCSALCTNMLPVDREGKPLRRAILYGIDSRTEKEISFMKERAGELFSVAGNVLSSQSVGPKILWFKNHEPEKFKKTYKIFSASDYIGFKLTEKTIVDYYTASIVHPFFDYNRFEWNKELINFFGISPSLFPDLGWPTDVAGSLTESASKSTHLKKNTPVIVGTGDALSSLVSAGGINEGDVTLVCGSTGCIVMTSDKKLTHPSLFAEAHAMPTKYILEGSTSCMGDLLKWYVTEFCYEERSLLDREKRSIYEFLDKEADKVPVGSNGLIVLPYFRGERTPILDPMSTGLMIGLGLHHKKIDIYRALLESFAYSIKHHVDIAKEAGYLPKRLIATNGGAKSKIFREIISDVLGLQQVHPLREMGSAVGDAYLCGIALNLWKWKDLNNVLRENCEITEPNEENHALYQSFYNLYRKIYPSNKEYMHMLSSGIR